MDSKWVFLFGFGPRFRFLKSLVFTDLVSDYFEGVQIDSMFGFGPRFKFFKKSSFYRLG